MWKGWKEARSGSGTSWQEMQPQPGPEPNATKGPEGGMAHIVARKSSLSILKSTRHWMEGQNSQSAL